MGHFVREIVEKTWRREGNDGQLNEGTSKLKVSSLTQAIYHIWAFVNIDGQPGSDISLFLCQPNRRNHRRPRPLPPQVSASQDMSVQFTHNSVGRLL